MTSAMLLMPLSTSLWSCDHIKLTSHVVVDDAQAPVYVTSRAFESRFRCTEFLIAIPRQFISYVVNCLLVQRIVDRNLQILHQLAGFCCLCWTWGVTNVKSFLGFQHVEVPACSNPSKRIIWYWCFMVPCYPNQEFKLIKSLNLIRLSMGV